MMKEICERNGGFRFKGGVKIKKRSEHKALMRIKEKMLANYYDLDKMKDKYEDCRELRFSSASTKPLSKRKQPTRKRWKTFSRL
jgi:hypothetical protein